MAEVSLAPMLARVSAIHQRSDQSRLVLLVLLLTLGTGVVDAVSYFSLDRVFTANMTGNMALLGIGVMTHLGSVEGNIFAFAGFVAGSIGAGRFLRWRVGTVMTTARHALSVQFAALVALTVVVASVNVQALTDWRYAVCFFLAAAMGLQTGVARHLAVQDVNTTVATMTLHDLAAASRLAGGDSVRWRRRAGVVVALFVGAAAGTGLDQLQRWSGLALAAAIVGIAIAAASAIARDEERPDRSSLLNATMR
jgi:uncharacterized membrane protein YoaK (UPF0700 family)